MGLKVHGDTIESLIKERREAEREARDLKARIDLKRAEREALPGQNSEAIAALDEQIGQLRREKRERSDKLKNICRVVQTISAGD